MVTNQFGSLSTQEEKKKSLESFKVAKSVKTTVMVGPKRLSSENCSREPEGSGGSR